MFKWIGDAIANAINNFFITLTNQAITLMMQLFASMNASTTFVLDTELVKQGIIFAQTLAGVYLAAKVTYEAYMTYVARLDGDPDADPMGLLLRTIRAAVVISAIPWIVRQVYKLGSNLALEVAHLPGLNPADRASELQSQVSAVVNTMTNFIFFAFLAVVIGVILTVIILIQVAIRAAELAIAVVAGSFMALGLTNEESQAFSVWMRNLLALCLTQATQLFLLKYSFVMLMQPTSVPFLGTLFSLLLFLGGMWVTIKSPSTIKEYVMSTGVSGAAGSLVRSLVYRGLRR